MIISKHIKEAVDRVFRDRGYEEDRHYAGCIGPEELQQAAFIVGTIKQEISDRGKNEQNG